MLLNVKMIPLFFIKTGKKQDGGKTKKYMHSLEQNQKTKTPTNESSKKQIPSLHSIT